MKLSFHSIRIIHWQRFFIDGYIISLLLILIGIIAFSAIVFHSTLMIGVADSDIESPAIDISVVRKLEELLDVREEYFNSLRAETPSVKDPFQPR